MVNAPVAALSNSSGKAASRGASVLLRNVSKVYASQIAAEDISLDIKAGEFMTFLGPSGSGKTTTLNMIAGFTDVTSGHILLDGEPIERRPPHKRDIGMVFQSYALFPHLTVQDNIAFPLRRRRVAKAEIRERVGKALAMVQLDTYGSRYPNQLSGGQQQRVALARALVFEPSVLLMDEPLGALDKKLREWLQLEIKRIHQELGITFLYVTHDQEEALVLSDRIALFNKGQVEQLGTADELYQRPETRFAAEFLGESNIITGTLASAGTGLVVNASGDQFQVGQGLEHATHTAGEAAFVVRPERTRILLDAQTDQNVVSGVVRQVIYLGLARRLEVELPSGQVVLVREQAGAFSSADEGQGVRVGWSADDARLVKCGD